MNEILRSMVACYRDQLALAIKGRDYESKKLERMKGELEEQYECIDQLCKIISDLERTIALGDEALKEQ